MVFSVDLTCAGDRRTLCAVKFVTLRGNTTLKNRDRGRRAAAYQSEQGVERSRPEYDR